MTTTIRTTCDGCQRTFDVPSTAIIVELAAPSADADAAELGAHLPGMSRV